MRRRSGLSLVGALGLVAAAICGVLATQAGGATGVDLAVTKSDSPDPIQVGEQLTYTIPVKNEGTSEATDVTVSDELPGSVDFVSANHGCIHNASTATVTCSIGNLKPGQTQQVKIVVRPREAGQIRNRASAVANEKDDKPSNDRADARTTVNGGPQPPTCGGRPATIVDLAGRGPGVISGTPRPDVIMGLGGNDAIRALGGGDVVCGGPGDDAVAGNAGADRLRGGRGSDALRGGPDGDRLNGGIGNDALNGGAGRDECLGLAGRDVTRRCEN
jgi:uncharacterized repeat protein (TIGR01451 family)